LYLGTQYRFRMPGKTKLKPFTLVNHMETPRLTAMVVLYSTGVRLDTNKLVNELPLTPDLIKIEKQGVLRRGESSKDRIRRRHKTVAAPKRTTGFGHNSITTVIMSDGDGSLLRKEITVKIFQNGVFHVTGVLHEKYDRAVSALLSSHISTTCPSAIVSGEWNLNTRRVVLMNYKTCLPDIKNLSRESLYRDIREQGVRVDYEPAVHPAVRIYFADKRWIAKVFRTGQVILTGITADEECLQLVTALNTMLRPFIQSTQTPTSKHNAAT
jgi:hypothetical protein